MPHTRSVAIGFFIGTGSRYEKDKQAGISHFIEHMCFKGTKKRPTSADVSTVIEGVGGMFNAGTDKELTIYWIYLPALSSTPRRLKKSARSSSKKFICRWTRLHSGYLCSSMS
jgi:hypothetical protein